MQLLITYPSAEIFEMKPKINSLERLETFSDPKLYGSKYKRFKKKSPDLPAKNLTYTTIKHFLVNTMLVS